jgi:hypothetical protein
MLAAFGTQAIARTPNDAARTMARFIVSTARSDANNAAADASAAREHYAPAEDCMQPRKTRCKTCRVCVLTMHVWPRTGRIRAAERAADAAARKAASAKDANAVYDMSYRAHRLSVLAARSDAAAARIGRFSLSRADMHADTSRFIRSAAYKRYMFKGGRDVGSREFSMEDVFQGALVRAIESGDAMFGVPFFGSMFRHVQAERAHLTRISGAEWRGIQDALHGARATERAYPATDDVHAIRRLGASVPSHHADSLATGRKYGTRDDHAAAMGDAAADAARTLADENAVHDARSLAILAAPADAFGRIVAEVMFGGATLADIAAAMGLQETTVRARAIATGVPSYVDHTTEDAPAADETRDALTTQTVHAARLQERQSLAARADYMRRRRDAVLGINLPVPPMPAFARSSHEYYGRVRELCADAADRIATAPAAAAYVPPVSLAIPYGITDEEFAARTERLAAERDARYAAADAARDERLAAYAAAAAERAAAA